MKLSKGNPDGVDKMIRWVSVAAFLSLSLGTGMTLPTGVSTFLLECLDVDSTADYNTAITAANDSLSSLPSPETFRDDGSGENSAYLM